MLSGFVFLVVSTSTHYIVASQCDAMQHEYVLATLTSSLSSSPIPLLPHSISASNSFSDLCQMDRRPISLMTLRPILHPLLLVRRLSMARRLWRLVLARGWAPEIASPTQSPRAAPRSRQSRLPVLASQRGVLTRRVPEESRHGTLVPRYLTHLRLNLTSDTFSLPKRLRRAWKERVRRLLLMPPNAPWKMSPCHKIGRRRGPVLCMLHPRRPPPPLPLNRPSSTQVVIQTVRQIHQYDTRRARPHPLSHPPPHHILHRHANILQGAGAWQCRKAGKAGSSLTTMPLMSPG